MDILLEWRIQGQGEIAKLKRRNCLFIYELQGSKVDPLLKVTRRRGARG